MAEYDRNRYVGTKRQDARESLGDDVQFARGGRPEKSVKSLLMVIISG